MKNPQTNNPIYLLDLHDILLQFCHKEEDSWPTS